MRNLANKLMISSLVAACVSCTGKFEDINTQPYQPESLEADGYALTSAMNNIAGTLVSTDVNTAQFTEVLMGGCLSGYYAPSKSAWTSTISNYNPTDDWTNVLLKSDQVIPKLYSNLTLIKSLSERDEDPVPWAVAQIMKVAIMHRVADTYGPIPYTKIGDEGSITTPYDAPEETYDAFFNELDESIATLQANAGSSLVASADYIYSGDLSKWIKFANSLKLRLAMRIVYADQEKAKEIAEEAVKADNGGVIESNADNAMWKYFSSSVNNTIYTASRYNQAEDCETGGDTHAAADIICYMNGYNDNRRSAYFVESEWEGETYVGLRHGIVIPAETTTRKYSGIKVDPTDPACWMNAAEVAFLRAEAVAVFGFNMGGTAQEFYEEGIRLSFNQYEATGVEAYLIDDTSKPTTYIDPAGTDSYSGTISTITIKWDDAASTEVKQERIITQKWIANWMMGNESWADFRRTGYPHLIPASAAGNMSGGVVDSEKGARRMPYPSAEYTDNLANIQYAVTNYLKGPDNMATDVWWACKP